MTKVWIGRWSGVLLAAAWLAISCQRSKDLPLEAGFGGEDVVGTLHEVILRPTEIKQIHPNINFGLGYYLFVGQRNGLTCKSFLLFDALPESALVSEAELRFTFPIRYGSDPLRVRAHPVLTEWKEEDVTWSTMPEFDGTRTIGDTVWRAEDSLGVAIRLDTAVVNEWIWHPESNKGLVIEADPGGQTLFELYSIDAGDLDLAPRLWLRYTTKGQLDSAITYPSADVFAANWDIGTGSESYVVTSQDVRRLLVKFDLSNIPDGATVNRAQFEWSLDPSTTLFEDATLSLSIHAAREWPWEGEYVLFDSTTYRAFITLTKSDNLLRITSVDEIGNFSHVLQMMLAGALPDAGFLLRIAREDAAVAKVGFVTADSDSTTGPRLIVTYTIPPGGK